eukprot:TRINITY_DN7047_c0_g1_i1.p1 TRINITY_DN7047_c0_g1~~TRINITY_DN7047_c0_g1_i1.p1  ORF type:complete len:148 (-),score=15.42 TRINITY_DN7047_c0_g1_i1:162-605(-)
MEPGKFSKLAEQVVTPERSSHFTGDIETIRVLLSQGYPINNALDGTHQTLFGMAIKYDCEDVAKVQGLSVRVYVIQFLVDNGANVFLRDNDVGQPWAMASFRVKSHFLWAITRLLFVDRTTSAFAYLPDDMLKEIQLKFIQLCLSTT